MLPPVISQRTSEQNPNTLRRCFFCPITNSDKTESEGTELKALNCHAYGFFSRSGFEGVEKSETLRLYDLAEMYE